MVLGHYPRPNKLLFARTTITVSYTHSGSGHPMYMQSMNGATKNKASDFHSASIKLLGFVCNTRINFLLPVNITQSAHYPVYHTNQLFLKAGSLSRQS